MIGHYVTIKSDYSQATGKVISVQDQNFAQSYKITGVETNVWVTIQDGASSIPELYL
jgi:hypothetical protein